MLDRWEKNYKIENPKRNLEMVSYKVGIKEVYWGEINGQLWQKSIPGGLEATSTIKSCKKEEFIEHEPKLGVKYNPYSIGLYVGPDLFKAKIMLSSCENK